MDDAIAIARKQAPTQAEPRPARRKVLVVDDQDASAQTLAEVLEMLGHTVEIAMDGPSAVAKARANPPDVVICDIGMPGMSGCDVARALRAAGLAARLLALSGYARPDDVEAAIAAGFDAYVVKPADIDELERLLA
ncbi:MAG TPA: response regulator [Anaeromyxobacter sp.]